MRKFNRIFIALAVIFSVLQGGALAKEISNTGWLFDFESGLTWNGGNFSFNKNYNSSIFNLEDGKYNNVLKMPTEDLALGTLGTFKFSNTIEEKDYVLSFEFCALQENARYVMQWQTTDGKVITCFTINNNGVAGFSKSGTWAVDPPIGITQYYGGLEYEAGRWHKVEMAVDLDAKTRYYYIDGEYLGECKDTNFGNGLVGNIAILHGKNYVLGDIDTENQAVYLDNFKVTYKKNVSDSIDFESGTATIQNNESETIGIQNRNEYMFLVEEADGNKAGALKTYKTDSLSNSLMNIYFNGISDESPYRLSFRFKHTEGATIDIVPVSDERLGYMRICPNGNLKIVYDWNYLSKAEEISSTSGEWHTMDVIFTPDESLCEWYLDGVKVKGMYYSLNDATGTLSDISFQAIGTEEMVENQTPVFLIDDIEAESLNGAFFAEALVRDNRIVLSFNEYPESFDTSAVTVKNSSGSAVTVTSVEVSGKMCTVNLKESCVFGERYIVELPEGITSVFGKTLNSRFVGVDAISDALEVSVVPSEAGGIFTSDEDVSFDISIKNADDAKLASGIARVVNEDGEYLWKTSLNFNTTDSLNIKPQGEFKFGRLYLDISLKLDSEAACIEKRVPFSLIFSNGVKNENMGLSNHYTTRYETLISEFDKEIKINKIAGFGINREEFQWDQYEKIKDNYILTERQQTLFETLENNGMRAMPVLYNASWTYGREEGATKEFMPMPVTDYQMQRYSEYLKCAVLDTKEYNPLYEIGNEWNMGYWNQVHTWADGESVTLTVKDHYIPMMKTAYETIKNQNPDAMVAGLAVANEEMLPFIEECLLNGAAEYCDIISIHPYSVYQSPEEADIRGLVESVRELLKTTKKPDMPIMFSEWGWTSAPGILSEEMQAAYSVRGAALVEDRIDSLIWYGGQEKDYIASILEQNFGFVNGNKSENSLSAKPVYIAMSCYNSLTGDKEAGSLTVDENGTYSRVYKGKENSITQIWNPLGESSLKIEDLTIDGKAVLYDMYGNSEIIEAEDGFFEIEAGENPCYLEVLGFSLKSAEFVSEASEIGFLVSAVNNSSEAQDLTVIIAAYEGERLLNADIKRAKIESGFSGNLEIPKIPIADKNVKVKGFVWDENQSPIILKTLTD